MKTAVRNIILFAILLQYSFTSYSQSLLIDSLKKVLLTQIADTNKVATLISLSNAYQLSYPDSNLAYAQQALDLAEALHHDAWIFWSLTAVNGALTFTGDYPHELENAFKALSLSKKLNNPRITGYANGMLSDHYYNLGEYDTSLRYWREVMKIVEQWFPDERAVSWANLSRIYDGMNQPDSAMCYAKKAYEKIKSDLSLPKENYWSVRLVCLTYTLLGNAFTRKTEYDSALFYYRRGIPISENINLEINLIDGYNGMAAVYKATGHLDSAVWYAKKVLSRKIAKSYPISSLTAANLLSDVYELKNKPDSTLKYLKMAISLKENLFNREKIMAIQNLIYKEQEKQKEIADSKLKLRSQFITYFLLATFIAVLVFVTILLKNKRQKQLQRMRDSIADDLHDDIGSTLSSISILSELAKEKSPQAISLLDSIGENTLSIQENMSDIVWSLNGKNDCIENVLDRMSQFASEICEAKNIELDFTSHVSGSTSKLTMKQRKNFYLFFKEVINNAAKYSDAKKLSVRIFQKESHIEMNIRDNGKGFDMAKVSSGNGMSTLKKRGEELNGHYKIKSHLNEGTDVALKFKIT